MIPDYAGAGMGSNWEALKSKIQAGGKRKRAPEEPLLEGAPDAKRTPAQLSDVTGVTHVVAVDCEMVGVGPEGARSSLARCFPHRFNLCASHLTTYYFH